MVKQNVLLSLTMLFLINTTPIFSQQAAEIFIPIGKSPGISDGNSLIGEIESVSNGNKVLTITNPAGKFTVKINKKTNIWLDKSKIKKSNITGSVADCQPGRRVEINYSEPERTSLMTARWIKVEVVE